MSAYEPNSRHLREVLMFCFNMKKSAAKAHRMLSNTYGEAAINERTCREGFQCFKNGDFGVEDQHGICCSRIIGDGPHNFEPWSRDEDDTLSEYPSPNIHSASTAGHLSMDRLNILWPPLLSGSSVAQGSNP
ncbi:mariner Mos1 transposase [Trichonephila clavipes]|nr:mariner Mos1 transposase [Trichonephila clavipes]